MKKSIILQSFICLLAVSCTVEELDIATPQTSVEHEVFYASFESSEADTKVYIDEHVKILWDAEDQISIFNKNTLNQKYMFAGETGENSGEFHWVEDEFFGAGNDIDYICAVYPHLASTKISNSDVLTLTLPTEQAYRENSFGPGANTMVSVTNDHLLKFKNVGGYMVLKFYGGDSDNKVSVSSITLAGNSGEPLAGEATLVLPFEEEPTITMAPTGGKSITLDCGEDGVELGTTNGDATVFWLVVPPTHFENGFTLTVTDTNGDVFIKKTTRDLTVTRNSLLRIAPIAVEFNSAGLFLTDILPVNGKPKLLTELDEENRTVTVTMPTVTDFSDLLFNYAYQGNGVMVNGVDVVNGETHIDASGKTSLVVRNEHYGKSYKLIARNTGLPVVRITTSGYFTLEYLESFQNRVQGLDQRPKDTVDHRVWLPEADDYISIRIEKADGSPGMKYENNKVYVANTKIKGRGNYSWKWEKKPYALKFENKTEVLGMPAHKRWILLANWRDRTLLRNDAAFWLSRRAGLPYTVRGEFVELEINGEHRGNYYLCEQIKIDDNRVKITEMKKKYTDKTGGFLMEIDSYFDEIRRFRSAEFNLKYMFKDPDVDVKTDTSYRAAYHWMKGYIDTFEKSLMTESDVDNHVYEKYLDVNSAIQFVMVNELTGNRDFFQNGDEDHYGPHSTYLYKDKGKKLFMGPVWDFDYETFIPEEYYPKEGSGWSAQHKFCWRGFDNTGYYYYFMCHDPQFVQKVKTFWSSFKSGESLKTDFATYINSMVAKISLSQKFDEARWPGSSQTNRNDNHDYTLPFLDPDPDTEDAIKRMINSFNDRVDWMDGKITTLSTTDPDFKY